MNAAPETVTLTLPDPAVDDARCVVDSEEVTVDAEEKALCEVTATLVLVTPDGRRTPVCLANAGFLALLMLDETAG